MFSNGPPVGAKAPSGGDALAELAAGGASFVCTGRHDWNPESIDELIAAERTILDAAAAHGLHCWLQLGNVPDLSGRAVSANEQLLTNMSSRNPPKRWRPNATTSESERPLAS